MTKRWIVAISVLLTLTIVMQGVILYRQSRPYAQAVARQDPIRNAPKDLKRGTTGLPFKGNNAASVVLVEFSDFECPFCGRHANGVGVEIDREYVATGKVKQVFVNNPLEIHKNARLLATAAICSGEQTHYWEMHDALFRDTPTDIDSILLLAKSLPLKLEPFRKCMEMGSSASSRIELDLHTAKEFKLSGTPSFAVGRQTSDGQVKIDRFITGAQSITVFEKVINDELRAQS